MQDRPTWNDIRNIVYGRTFLQIAASCLTETVASGREAGFNVCYRARGPPMVSHIYRGSEDQIKMPFVDDHGWANISVHVHPDNSITPSPEDFQVCADKYMLGDRMGSYNGIVGRGECGLSILLLRSEDGEPLPTSRYRCILQSSYKDALSGLAKNVPPRRRKGAASKISISVDERKDLEEHLLALIPPFHECPEYVAALAKMISRTSHFSARIFRPGCALQ